MGINHTTDLRLISAYWCNTLSANYEQRFMWSDEKVDSLVEQIGETARGIIQALAISAPDKETASYFAAGALENYVNLVVEKRNSDEAAYIVNNPILKPYLKYVWGDVAQLMSLAKKGTLKSAVPVIETELQTLSLKEVMGYWCHECASNIALNYDKYYNSVIDKLLDQKTREETKHDLLVSAPDKKMEKYLHLDIFILQK